VKRSFTVLITFFLFLISVSSAQAISLSFVPDSSTVTQGGSVNVDLVVSDLGHFTDNSLSAYDLDVTFDSTLLTFNGITFGTGLDIWGLGGNITDVDSSTPGLIDFYEISFDFEEDLNDYQEGSFTLATLSFTASTTSTGTSALLFSDVMLSDAGWSSLTADTINSGSIEVASASSPVPEPATVLLLASGLLGMGFLKRRQEGVDKLFD